MIYSLNGKLIENEPNTAVIECGGVGYKCSVSLKTSAALPKIGENVSLGPNVVIGEYAEIAVFSKLVIDCIVRPYKQ